MRCRIRPSVCVGRRAYLADLVGELAGLLVVDFVRVQQVAERPEVGLLLEPRDEVVCVAAEPGGDDLTDLHLHVVSLGGKTQRTAVSV